MRAAEWGVSKKKSTEDDDFLKPQWLPRPGAAGISNQFRSAGGRKGGFDDRRTRRPDGLAFKPGSSLSPSEDFPPLAPFYRSHSTGSLTPADIPSASSRLLSASKEEKHFSINRECDFPTLAPATVVDQPARMHKSKSATALPQAISPSSDLLKAHHTTLSALAGAPVSPVAPVASPNVSAAVGTTPAPTEALAGGPAKQPQHSHQKKPSFSDKVSFSEIAASEKAVAANNRAKFERAAAANQRELQRLKSLVPSKPVHPSLSRTNGRAVRPKMPPVTTNVLKTAPSPSRESFAALPASPATLRKATSAPVLPMASNDHLLSRSPPSHPPSLLVPVVPDASTSGHAASSGPSSPPRPALMPSSRSARTLPQATTPFTSSSPPRPALMPSSRSARTLPQATVGMAPPGLVKHHTSFALPLASASRLPSVKQTGDSAGADSSTPSSSSSASSSSSFTGAPVASPRRRDSSPPAATSSAISSTRTSPLSSPRRSSSPATGGVPHHNSDPSLLSAPLSPRMPSAATVNGGSNSASSSSSSSSSFSSSSPSSSSSSSSAPPLTSSATASNGGKTAGKKTKPLRNSGSSSSSSAVSKQSASNGGKQQQQQQQSRKKKQQQQQQQQPNGRRRSSLPPDDDTSVESTGVARHATSGHRGTGLSNNNSNSCGGMTSEILAHPWLPRPTQTYTVFARHYPLQQPYHHHHRSGGGSSGSEGSGSEDDLAFETAEYDRVNDEELMLIATGATTCIAVPLIDINEEAQEEQDEAAASAAAWGGDSAGPLTEDLCPFSWEARADGKWNEWSEESVRTFMKEKLDYEVEVVGGQEDDEGQGLTDEEIRLAKQQISAGLQQMLEKKKRNLSESLKKAVAADLRLSTSTSPAQLHHHPRPAGTTTAATTTTAAAATATAADAAPVQSTSRRGHKQPLRSNSGPAAASLRGGQRRHHHLSPEHGHDVVLDSDSDESEGEEVHSFHGIVFG